MTKPSNTLERLRARTTEAGRYVLPLNQVWADKVSSAYTALRNAEVFADVDDPERARRIAEAQTEIDQLTANAGDEVIVFTFRRLSRAQYDAIVTRNPPTKEQIEEDKEKPSGQRRVFNTDTFPIDLLYTVLIEPKLDLETLSEIIEGPGIESEEEPVMSKGEAESLMSAAMSAALSAPRILPRELRLP